MGAELGATTSIFPYDERMATYLEATERARIATLAEANRDLLTADPEVEANPERYFDEIIEIDLDALEPHIVGPHSPDLARPVSRMAADVAAERLSGPADLGPDRQLHQLLLRGHLPRRRRRRQALAHGVKIRSPLWVTPGSEQIDATIERDGQMATLSKRRRDRARQRLRPLHRPVEARRHRRGEANSIITSFNRNFPKRNDGNPQTHSFIGSPEIVVAYALAGRLSFNPLTDPIDDGKGGSFTLAPPARAGDPGPGLRVQAAGYDAPPAELDRARRQGPRRQRAAAAARSPSRPGTAATSSGCRCCSRPRASAPPTTSRWPVPGCSSAATSTTSPTTCSSARSTPSPEEPGHGVDVETGETKSLPELARDYKPRGLRWVVVGDENYGEGSSREHAAMEPRHLGGAAVISRSFARIHETNLKKQGVLPLTFADPADYDKIHATTGSRSSASPGSRPDKRSRRSSTTPTAARTGSSSTTP